jgi:hypothetical protein
MLRRALRSYRVALLSLAAALVALGPLGPQRAEAQYIDRNLELKQVTQADYVTEEPPDWIGPYNWVWLPPHPDFEWSIVDEPVSSLDRGECTIAEQDGFVIQCNPSIHDEINWNPFGDGKADGLGLYQHDHIEEFQYTGGSSLVEKAQGGGYGKVVFGWTWRKHTVYRKLCDSTRTAQKTQEELINSDLVSHSQQDRIMSRRLDPDKINVDVHICRDDPTKREDGRPEPYDTWREMNLAKTKCTLQIIEDYDQGHRPKGDYRTTWRPSVPAGWFRGENEGFSRSKFMDWCMTGGSNPFSPKPFPEAAKPETDFSPVFEDQKIDDYGDPEVKRPWTKTEETAGSFRSENWAQRECERLYNEIIDRRENAFFQLCKDEPYRFWEGCQEQIKKCKSYQADNGDHVGVQQCCTDGHPEYHYHSSKNYEIPCRPIDAFVWEGRGAARDMWMNTDGGKADEVGGLAGRVYQDNSGDTGRGFVGSNAYLAPIGGDGEEMTVTVKGGDSNTPGRIGSYFWFDLLSGTIGLRSFEEAKKTQTVTLPATHKEACDTDIWESGNMRRGEPCGPFADIITGPFDSPDPVSDQRDEAHGWLYHIYFCPETFTEEETKLLSKKWGTVPARLDKAKDKLCADDETYRWNAQKSEFECMKGSTEQPPKQGPVWCNACRGFAQDGTCRKIKYVNWTYINSYYDAPITSENKNDWCKNTGGCYQGNGTNANGEACCICREGQPGDDPVTDAPNQPSWPVDVKCEDPMAIDCRVQK